MSKNRPSVLLAASIAFFVAVTITAYFKQNGLKDVAELKVAIEKIEKDTYAVMAENERYRQELISLNHSERYVNAIAREKLGLVKPGEVVYEFVDAERLGAPDIDISKQQ